MLAKRKHYHHIIYIPNVCSHKTLVHVTVTYQYDFPTEVNH